MGQNLPVLIQTKNFISLPFLPLFLKEKKKEEDKEEEERGFYGTTH